MADIKLFLTATGYINVTVYLYIYIYILWDYTKIIINRSCQQKYKKKKNYLEGNKKSRIWKKTIANERLGKSSKQEPDEAGSLIIMKVRSLSTSPFINR